MASLTDEDFRAAEERGRLVLETEPYARSARYDRATGLLVIELTNGAIYSVPARHLQGLSDASDDAISRLRIDSGYGLHWDDLDADFTIGGLLAGRFGTEQYMRTFRKRMQDAA